MRLFAAHKGRDGCPQSPRATADAIVAALLLQHHPMIGTVDVAGPGFINVFVAHEFMNARIADVLRNDTVPPPHMERRLQCMVDFSSPSIGAEMHAGHLRSTIIGDSICRVLEFVGHNVVRINRVGDWPSCARFGMLIVHLAEQHSNVLADPSR